MGYWLLTCPPDGLSFVLRLSSSYNNTFISNFWVKATQALFLLLGAIFSNNNCKQLQTIYPIKFFLNYFKLLFRTIAARQSFVLRLSSFVFFVCTRKKFPVRARQFFFCFAYAKIRHERGGLQIKCQKRHAKKHAHNFSMLMR